MVNFDPNSELQFLENVYGDDVDIVMLTGQMEILKVLLKDGDFLCFDDIILKIKELLTPERNMISESGPLRKTCNFIIG